ncbi:sulfite exporter TauE/SafE family protein [Candidatus Pelagibacter sp.]|nr:sulfite exporter TauE/SafE family protein [Candidatus Pelagibacter sp.]MDC3163862.1 sulfite exporter TauE/SafE family protein [Candidatus Pelagibacter sp.]|tara:strand:- start:711 stop:1796 length:1086 start_codon:yes stop_codon:yes gene_type:complete
MEYFLPIAQVEINILYIFGLSLVVGILSGLFGVGGGFLMTPFLIFLGIPPAYAVPNEASNILGTSVSGSTTHYLKGTLDYKMGLMIVVGGTIGTLLGILTFTYFQNIGKINIVISLAYMYILAILGTLMLIQGVSEIDKARKKIVVRKKLHTHYWIHGLPFRMRFKKSKLYESAFTPIIIGLIVGFIAAIMGVGGAFILVPAMIYIIGMPTKLIPGTSLFVTIFVSAIVTVLHAFNYGTIDLILVFVLILGSIIGVQFGQKIGEKVDSSEFKTILAILLLLVGIAIAYDTFIKDDIVVETVVNGNSSLGNIAQFILDYSKDLPVFYGLTSVVLAVVLGIGAAVLRNFISKWNTAREAKLKA